MQDAEPTQGWKRADVRFFKTSEVYIYIFNNPYTYRIIPMFISRELLVREHTEVHGLMISRRGVKDIPLIRLIPLLACYFNRFGKPGGSRESESFPIFFFEV